LWAACGNYHARPGIFFCIKAFFFRIAASSMQGRAGLDACIEVAAILKKTGPGPPNFYAGLDACGGGLGQFPKSKATQVLLTT
jgi:hypothetical protein